MQSLRRAQGAEKTAQHDRQRRNECSQFALRRTQGLLFDRSSLGEASTPVASRAAVPTTRMADPRVVAGLAAVFAAGVLLQFLVCTTGIASRSCAVFHQRGTRS
jgi:hypothetical protein